MEELKAEVSEQKAVNAGLRGELRKYTDLRSKLQEEVRRQHPQSRALFIVFLQWVYWNKGITLTLLFLLCVALRSGRRFTS